MKKIATIIFISYFLVTGTVWSQGAIFSEDFETGTASTDWSVFFAGEENVTAVPMSSAPQPLANGGNYAGYLQDSDGSYTGIAVAVAGDTSLQNYSIEGDVYCYVNHPGGSAYTGLVVYANSDLDTYIKLVADFDSDQRFRLYNNHFDMTTFTYTFHHAFTAADIPGGIPTEDGWHHMKVEVKTVDDTTTAFWCYFDGEQLAGCPVYDTSVHQMDSGQFGVFSFQMDADGIAGYFDNIIVQTYGTVTSVEERQKIETIVTPKQSQLAQNYPNPFNPETQISYQIFHTEFVDLTIYDLLGRKIKTLVSEIQAPNSYTVTWDGRDEYGNKMPSGVYLYTLQTRSFAESKKMLMLK